MLAASGRIVHELWHEGVRTGVESIRVPVWLGRIAPKYIIDRAAVVVAKALLTTWAALGQPLGRLRILPRPLLNQPPSIRSAVFFIKEKPTDPCGRVGRFFASLLA